MPDELRRTGLDNVRELQEITAKTDTRDYLHAAARQRNGSTTTTN